MAWIRNSTLAFTAAVLSIGAARSQPLAGQVAFDRPETQAVPGGPSLELTSPEFKLGKPMPITFSAYGKNISPPLAWSAGPPTTKSYVLIVQDPDAGGPAPRLHWLAYDIPAAVRSLSHAIKNSPAPTSPLGMLQGWNDHDSVGYTGPHPPVGDPPHHYDFQIYALDRVLRVRPGARLDAVIRALQGHVLARGELTTTYAQAEPKLKPAPPPAAE